MNKNTIQETTSNNEEITKPNRQADVLDQTRLRPQRNEAKIISLLLNLKSLGKADLTMKFISDRLEFLAKHACLNDADSVNWFIARAR